VCVNPDGLLSNDLPKTPDREGAVIGKGEMIDGEVQVHACK